MVVLNIYFVSINDDCYLPRLPALWELALSQLLRFFLPHRFGGVLHSRAFLKLMGDACPLHPPTLSSHLACVMLYITQFFLFSGLLWEEVLLTLFYRWRN